MAGVSGEQWSIDISNWCKKANKKVDTAARAIVLTIFSGVIEKTPVDTGMARGNWQIGFDTIPRGILSAPDRTKGSASGRVQSALGNQPIIGHVVYLVNNLPYIGTLEYGGYPNPPKHGSWVKGKKGGHYVIKSSGGYSKQAPAGMVRVTLSEISQRVQEGIAKGKANG